MRCFAGLIAWVAATLLVGMLPGWADKGGERPPNVYVGPGVYWNLEKHELQPTVTLKFAGREKLVPDWGIYDGHWLVGAQYLILGTRSECKRLYGGPGIVWYRGGFGPSFTVGTHLTDRMILEGDVRWTSDWDGAATIGVGYGFNWRLLGK